VQDDFEAGYVELGIAGSGAPLGVNASTVNLHPTAVVNRTLPQVRTMHATIASQGGVTMVSRAGTNVSFDILAENTGNLILRGSSLASKSTQDGTDVTLDLVCTQPVDIPVGGVLSCTAMSPFDQDGMELGDRIFSATGTSVTLVTDTHPSDTVDASPSVTIDVVEIPLLVVDVMGAECTRPARMPGNVTCKVQLYNSGNQRLQDLSVQGDVNDCVFAGPLWPAETVNCSMTRWVCQDGFRLAVRTDSCP
jgi:hypothetical protein